MIDLRRGDCLKVMADLPPIDAVVTDPPYGIGLDTNYARLLGRKARFAGTTFTPIHGDDAPFDPSPWLKYPKVVMFGFHRFADKLPAGSLLVWCKRRAADLGKYMADAEIAWKKGGHGIYLFNHEWRGFCRASERGEKTLHPTQKPIAVMRWCIEKLRLKPGATILDPYMGLGATGVAAAELGFNFIGIEKHAPYFRIASRRIKAAEAARGVA